MHTYQCLPKHYFYLDRSIGLWLRPWKNMGPSEGMEQIFLVIGKIGAATFHDCRMDIPPPNNELLRSLLARMREPQAARVKCLSRTAHSVNRRVIHMHS